MTVIKPTTKSDMLNLVLDTLERKKQALIFVNSKRSAEKVAEDIAKQIKKLKLPVDESLNDISSSLLSAASKPTKQCKRVSECVKFGIAFHHAGLHSKQKQQIEESFRTGKIKIIACTPTLAYGLDLPAYRAIIRDVRRYGPRGLAFIPVLEYLQICGRAGRPKYDSMGEAIILCSSDAMREEVTERYIKGEPENIYSKLAVEPVLRTYLLSLISFVRSKSEIIDFFSKTFWAFQYKDMDELGLKIENMLAHLIDWEFIESSSESSTFVSADEFGGDEKFTATFLGERIAKLYLDPLTGHEFVKSIKRSEVVKERKDFSYLQLISNTLEMRPKLRVKVKEFEEINEIEAKFEPYLLQLEPSLYDLDYDEFLNSIKTAFMLNEWMDEKDEDYLLQKFNVRPGELRVKLFLADWLIYCVSELAQILQMHPLIKEIKKCRFRLKYGVKEELIPLLKLKNVGRVRARTMFNNKLKTIKDLKVVDLSSLAQIIGKRTAISIKEQLGEKITIEISPKKRKGQLSLNKFQ